MISFSMKTDLHFNFIEIAEKKKNEAENAFNFGIDKMKKGEQIHNEIAEERQTSMISIMFSVFALESYINMKGHDLLEKDVWNEYKSRLGLKEKWHFIPLLISGKTFNINNSPFTDFKQIVKWRNY